MARAKPRQKLATIYHNGQGIAISCGPKRGINRAVFTLANLLIQAIIHASFTVPTRYTAEPLRRGDAKPCDKPSKENAHMAYVMIPGYLCERCGYRWAPKSPGLPEPKVCTKCKSPYWNQPRRFPLRPDVNPRRNETLAHRKAA